MVEYTVYYILSFIIFDILKLYGIWVKRKNKGIVVKTQKVKNVSKYNLQRLVIDIHHGKSEMTNEVMNNE